MSHFGVAGLQLSLRNGDNLDDILAQIRLTSARFPWVQMTVLSELATFGANPEKAINLNHDAIDQYCSMAKELGIWLIPGSFHERDGEAIYNTAPVINPDGKVITSYRKMYPFLPYEDGITPGSEFVTFDVPYVGRFGVSICYDKWFPETTRALVWNGAEVIIHPNLTTSVDRNVEHAITRSNAASNQCYFFEVNTAAPFGMGESTVCGPGGEVIHQASSSEEVFAIELDLNYVRRVRERGWQNLCQTMKSFRDSEVVYPQYGSERSASLDKLGKLEIPGTANTPDTL
jgi:predicted amidohydrolase